MKRKITLNSISFVFLFLFIGQLSLTGQEGFFNGDPLPDAPELAKRGSYTVGVRTLDFVNKNQIDILNSKEGNDITYDRNLKVEIWYPAEEKTTPTDYVQYEEVLGTRGDSLRPLIPFTFKGKAVRDAVTRKGDMKYPLIIVSHGYVGSRYLMTYLTENLASKGYVVVAIDHTDSTFKDAAPFQSTLLNRALDVHFVLDEIENLGSTNREDSLAKIIDTDNTGILGYSMGGYGVLNVAGAGYSPALGQFFTGMTGGSTAISKLLASNAEFKGGTDSRIKAVVAFAPWGMERGVWNDEGLKGLKTPTFFVAGSQDDISGYEKGIKAIHTGTVNADRYLLTYKNARHNVAPNPPPAEALQPGLHIDEYYRYAEPSWDQRKINNINQHFMTAFFGTYLKGEDFFKYLDLPENSNEKTWEGFKNRSSTGMELLFSKALE